MQKELMMSGPGAMAFTVLSETRNPEPGTRIPKSELLNPKTAILNPKPEI